MSNQALTPAQKAQITKQRKKLEEQAYAARLEEQGRGARTTKTKALDNAVWRGAAPTGHAPTQKQSTKKPAQQRRRLPPSIASSGDSDEYVSEAPQPPKRPRLVNTAERLFDDDSNVNRPAPKPRKQSKPAIDDEDADIEEDYQDYHGPGEDDSADEGANSQPEDQDLIGITTTQLRNEVPHLEAEGPNTERSPLPGINIPDVDLEMTTTTEFEDFDNANQDDCDDAAAHANMRSRSGKRCKPSGRHCAQARCSEKPTFSDGANVPNTNCYPQPDDTPGNWLGAETRQQPAICAARVILSGKSLHFPSVTGTRSSPRIRGLDKEQQRAGNIRGRGIAPNSDSQTRPFCIGAWAGQPPSVSDTGRTNGRRNLTREPRFRKTPITPRCATPGRRLITCSRRLAPLQREGARRYSASTNAVSRQALIRWAFCLRRRKYSATPFPRSRVWV
ncbi:hypothetical protein BC835DRAFT_1414649 [Cytidiella melzeri]|nr:hypothetical protein BC835DRAFT_1414649 [Cytidiella melzeri]